MIVTAEYLNDTKYKDILTCTLKKAQKNISKEQIAERKKQLMENQPLWKEVSLHCKISRHYGNIKLDLFEYVQDLNSEVVQELLTIFIEIIAFYELTIEGKVMPLCSDFYNIFELDITHQKGNSIFKIQFNEMNYNKFLIINN